MDEKPMETEKRRDENSYRNILKGTSIFGGVQLFHILVSLLRGKLVAMLLGATGMGVSSLYVSSSAMVQKFASLGLNFAVVREVGSVKDDPKALSEMICVVRRLLLATAFLGAMVCICLSRWLSEWSFGDTDHTIPFMTLGMMVFFTIMGNGEMSLLQGVHDVKRLARATMVGSLCGLLVSVPLYWLYGVDGIVPAMIILALAVYLFYYISTRRAGGVGTASFEWRRHSPIVKRLLVAGLLLMSGDLINSFFTYGVQAYIRFRGGLADVGLYQGANSMTLQYAGVVFAAMAMDYFPRLTAVSEDDDKVREVVNRQLEIVGYIIAPLAALMVIFAPLIVRILLTAEFESAVPLLRWMGIALMVRGLMYPLGYVTFAKGDKKVYFYTEGLVANVLMLVMAIAGYALFGLIGLGYAMVAENVLCMLLYIIVNGRLYRYRMSPRSMKACLYASGVTVVVGSLCLCVDTYIGHIIAGVVVTLSLYYSYRHIKSVLRS